MSERDGSPSWSLDATHIAFASERDGNLEIYTIAADGTDPVNLTNNPASDGTPSWSPDGDRTAFASDRDPPATPTATNKNAPHQPALLACYASLRLFALTRLVRRGLWLPSARLNIIALC